MKKSKMPYMNQTDCFDINKIFWKILGIYPLRSSTGRIYHYYSRLILITLLFLYVALFTLNFYFLDRQLDSVIEEMLLYFTEVSVLSKSITFLVKHKEIANIFKTIDKNVFQPVSDKEYKIIEKAKKVIKRYWKIVAAVSLTSNVTHLSTPFITHLFLPVKLKMPVSSYSFISEETMDHWYFLYPLFVYQALGMHFCMWCNVNVHTFILGLMIIFVAQLDILDAKLRNITNFRKALEERRQEESRDYKNDVNKEAEKKLLIHLKGCVVHFEELSQFCSLIQGVFGVTLFVQFGVASIIICVCLFRFTLPAPFGYIIFLVTYQFIMVSQILVPCWFGTRIMDKSNDLAKALYDCEWTPRPRIFKTNMRLFVERCSKPLSITGWKMFPLSLTTFTSIMNSAYSFFTLLRHMQSRE